MEKINITNKFRLVVYGVLAVIFLSLFIRAHYSFCQNDEASYLTYTGRIWSGAGYVTDEWHPAQFFTLPLLPIYGIYVGCTGSTDGIYLFFRLVMLGVSLAAALFYYHTLRKDYSDIASGIGAAFILLFSRANIWGPSYYNLYALSLLCAVLCLIRAKASGEDRCFCLAAMMSAGLSLPCVFAFSHWLLLADHTQKGSICALSDCGGDCWCGVFRNALKCREGCFLYRTDRVLPWVYLPRNLKCVFRSS